MTNYIFLSKDDFTIEQLQNLKIIQEGLIKIEDQDQRYKCASTVYNVMVFYRFGAEVIQAQVMSLMNDIKEEIKNK